MSAFTPAKCCGSRLKICLVTLGVLASIRQKLRNRKCCAGYLRAAERLTGEKVGIAAEMNRRVTAPCRSDLPIAIFDDLHNRGLSRPLLQCCYTHPCGSDLLIAIFHPASRSGDRSFCNGGGGPPDASPLRQRRCSSEALPIIVESRLIAGVVRRFLCPVRSARQSSVVGGCSQQILIEVHMHHGLIQCTT